jgi:hypothetical protein
MFVFKFFAITESIYLQALLPNSEVFIVIKRANNQGRYFKEQETEIIISQTDRQTDRQPCQICFQYIYIYPNADVKQSHKY